MITPPSTGGDHLVGRVVEHALLEEPERPRPRPPPPAGRSGSPARGRPGRRAGRRSSAWRPPAATTTLARSSTPTKPRTVAMTQTAVWSRRTGMPSRAARSPLSDAARMATPTSVKRMKAARAPMITGTDHQGHQVVAGERRAGRRRSAGSTARSGSRRGCRRRNRRGSRIETKVSSCDSPMVATVRISRGALVKRRMTASSTTAPRTTAAASPRSTDQPHGQCHTVDQPDHQHRRRRAQLGLGEVQDPVGPVDERHAQGHQRADAPEDQPEHPLAGGQREEGDLEPQDRGHRRGRPGQRLGSPQVAEHGQGEHGEPDHRRPGLLEGPGDGHEDGGRNGREEGCTHTARCWAGH